MGKYLKAFDAFLPLGLRVYIYVSFIAVKKRRKKTKIKKSEAKNENLLRRLTNDAMLNLTNTFYTVLICLFWQL